MSALRPKVLVVDDEPANALAVEALLGDLPLDVVRAHSGKEALRWVLTTPLALILLDVRMPGMDGVETARLIREREKSRSVPIIFFTAYPAELELIHDMYRAGAADFISKPMDPLVLRSKVSVFAGLFSEGAGPEASANATGLRPPEASRCADPPRI